MSFTVGVQWAVQQHLEHVDEQQRQRQLRLQREGQGKSLVQSALLDRQRRSRQQQRKELEPLRRKLVSMSYGSKGADPVNLFSMYDRDNSGYGHLCQHPLVSSYNLLLSQGARLQRIQQCCAKGWADDAGDDIRKRAA